MFHNKKDFTEEIFLDRDTSQPKEKFKFRKKINESQVQRSFNKSSNFKFKTFLDNEKNNEDINNSIYDRIYKNEKENNKDYNNNYNNKNKENDINNDNNNLNNKENGRKIVNEEDKNSKKSLNKKNNYNNDNSSNINNNNDKNNQINKETQNAFVQVNLINEIIEIERKNFSLKYKEKETEMKLKIKNLIQDMKLAKFESNKEIMELKTKINEKKEEIIDLRNLNSNLKKQIETLNEQINNLNNKIIELKKKNAINNIRRNYGDVNDLNKTVDNNKQNNRYTNIIDINSLPTMNKLQKEKNKIHDELEKIKEFKKIVPTRTKLNKSTNDFQNKFKFNSLLINLNKKNKDLINKNNLNNSYQIEPNLSFNSLNKKFPNNRRRESLEKMQKDYSVRIYNDMFEEFNNDLIKRSNSAGVVNLKKSGATDDKLNKNIFNSIDRKALSTLIDQSQEEIITFDRKINMIENRSEGLLNKLLLKKKENTKGDSSFHKRNRNNENLN